VKESPSTYFVQDRRNKNELTRLALQDQMITIGMGGVLPEQCDPTVFRRVLDVGCGTGGWLIGAAKTYPTMSLVGIDISQRMIKHAYTQAEAHQVGDRVEFYIMDALDKLDFPAAFFDLVSLRLSISFVRTWDWPKLLRELLRVTRPGGVVRVTESEVVFQSNSPALTQLCEMSLRALFRAGRLFEEESAGLVSHLAQLLDQCGCQQVQTKAHAIEYRAGTAEGENFCKDIMLAFQVLHPFLEKRGCTSKDYGAIYHNALKEMRQPDFLATVNLLTAWGSKLS
jgi:ubiquinone/menaquinone biosynthesis C-methylase UbiE